MWESRRFTAEARLVGMGKLSILLLMVLLLGTLCACGTGATDKVADAPDAMTAAIEAATNAEMKKVTAGNVEDYEALYGMIAFSPEPYGVTWKCFSDNYFPQVSYTINKVEKTSSGYTSFVTLKTCEADDLNANLARASGQARAELASSSSSTAVPGFADHQYLDIQANNPLVMRDVSLELYFVQDANGTWTLSNEDVLLGSVIGGFDGRQEAV